MILTFGFSCRLCRRKICSKLMFGSGVKNLYAVGVLNLDLAILVLAVSRRRSLLVGARSDLPKSRSNFGATLL